MNAMISIYQGGKERKFERFFPGVGQFITGNTVCDHDSEVFSGVRYGFELENTESVQILAFIQLPRACS